MHIWNENDMHVWIKMLCIHEWECYAQMNKNNLMYDMFRWMSYVMHIRTQT